MSFEISWYIPERVIYIRLTGELDINAAESMARAIREKMEVGIAPVHILLDDIQGGRPPINLNQLKSRLTIGLHPSMGWVVAIGEADPVAKFILPLLMKIMNIHFTRLPTLDEALDFLAQQDMTLEK